MELFSLLASVLIKNPFEKIITLSILVAGAVIFMVARGYLDVAIVVSLMMPIGTIFILILCRK